MSTLILANFGGPRSLQEIPEFLTSLLTDEDVIRTPFPRFFEKWFFQKVALKRAQKIAHDYALIGGKSPIFEDTEAIARELRILLGQKVITFHRYLPATHAQFFEEIAEEREMVVLPLYPQFSYATTGSIARYFEAHIPECERIEWIRSYAIHDRYIEEMQATIREFLEHHQLDLDDVVLFFSAHGLPQAFVDRGDPYERECRLSFDAIKAAFPQALSILAFQSKFGPGEWLRPYTSELSENPLTWSCGRKRVVFIPLSFTSDHIETLFEVEFQYLPLIRRAGLSAYRCPALNRRSNWLRGLAEIAQTPGRYRSRALVRR